MEYDKKTFPVRAKADFYVHGTQPADKVERISKALRDAAPEIEKAGNTYVNAGSVLATCLQRIEDAARRMADVWGDKASVEAQLALKSLHESIDQVSGRFNMMGRPLESLGRDVLPKYGDSGGWDGWGGHATPIQGMKFLWYDNGSGGGTSWFASANDVATKHLQRLNHDLETWYNLLPPDVSRTLPKIDASTATDLGLGKPDPLKGPGGPNGGTYPAGFDPTAGGGSPNGAGVGPIPGAVSPSGVGGPTAGSPTVPGSGQDGGPGGVGAGGPGGAGVQDPGGVTPSPTPATPPQTTPNSPVGSTPDANQPNLPPQPQVPDPNADAGKDPGSSTPGSRDTSLADFQQPKFDTPTSPNATPYTPANVQSPAEIRSLATPTVVPGASTGAGDGRYAGLLSPGVRAGDAAGSGMPMYPPMHGSGHQPEESNDGAGTWLHEVDDVWGGPADDTTGHTLRHDQA
ncbi:hypothetical protein MTP10_07365 [Nonomuraea sp. 3-1Str]|uniref:hypothetical protein n=1 Tax=Nonomuraea sp. 3-1Str TaxID=2929801 RepID=UPI002864D235|nr:hypothetical protein [Nonomuraea sp. 3-1Str]MDR8408552.1 hypothetical protein [Nonomuraea sp. 3-1Str]